MAFKLGDELMHMIGDFANMNRSPDFKVKTNNENPQKALKPRTERIHSINLAVGVSDEPPPFNEPNTGIRRQSSDKILQATQPINQRTLSAPVHMKDDCEQIRKKYAKFALLKDKNNGIEESGLEVLPEEETDSPVSTPIDATESTIIYKEASTVGDDNDNASINATILSPVLLHTKIINNVGHRGSIVLIDE
uniref:Uncharacterized protein n=1 Tax=Onchocerca volvulus TaxID=6282 RepID=A0A8R1TWR6_ONCVO